MSWDKVRGFKLKRGGAIAAGAIAVAVVGAVIVALAASSGAAGLGFERLDRVFTLSLPPAANDRIYGLASARGRPIVVIDAGHGGRDPGASGVSTAAEKDFTLALARELRDTLVKRGRVRVAMTRDGDLYRTLDDRAAVARRLGAASFISLHVDSAANPLARGASIYSLSDVASDAESARLAAVENRGVTAIAGANSIDAILTDLAMRSQMIASADLAARLVGKSAGRVELRANPHRFAAFHVLRRAGVPAVLFEAGYISNVDDETLLRDPKYRTKVVAAIADSVESDVARRANR